MSRKDVIREKMFYKILLWMIKQYGTNTPKDWQTTDDPNKGCSGCHQEGRRQEYKKEGIMMQWQRGVEEGQWIDRKMAIGNRNTSVTFNKPIHKHTHAHKYIHFQITVHTCRDDHMISFYVSLFSDTEISTIHINGMKL
jgi:hypothetical protein